MTDAIRMVLAGDDAEHLEVVEDAMAAAAGVQVVGTARDTAESIELFGRRSPGVVVVVVRGERGLGMVSDLREDLPVPIVVCAATRELGDAALSRGAMEAILYAEGERALLVSVRLMANLPVVRRHHPRPPRESSRRDEVAERRLVAIGGSTGAPAILTRILADLTAGTPAAVLLVQHMPEDYSESFVDWLGQNLSLPVRLATHRARPEPGVVLVAPADSHMSLGPDGAIAIEEATGTGPAPSVDRLFESLAALPGHRVLAVLLSGMGRDGARGLLALRRAGAWTEVQDEASCAVFGMPGAALELGGAERALDPEALRQRIATWSA